MNAPNDGSPDAALPASDLEADPAAAPAAWYGPDGSIVSCTEKVKVLEENWRELRAALQDALDDADSATVGGWTLERFGTFPKPGDSFRYENLTVTVMAMDGRRVERVLVQPDPASDKDE